MTIKTLSAAALMAAILLSPLASASGFNPLQQRASNLMSSLSQNQTQAQTTTGGLGALLGQMATGSLNLGSVQNVAGVLGYCQKQGYAPSAAKTVKNKLLSRLGGGQQTRQNPSYQNGLAGLLESGQGQNFSLTNLKHNVGQRVCSAVANRALSSFLGQ